MKPSSVHIKDMLESESSLALTFGTDLFVGREPTSRDAQDNVVTIIDTPGGPIHLTNTKENSDYQYPTVQIRIRNNDLVTGWELAEDIVASLHGRAGETYDGVYYSLVRCTSGPAALMWDENERVVLVINFEIQRR